MFGLVCFSIHFDLIRIWLKNWRNAFAFVSLHSNHFRWQISCETKKYFMSAELVKSLERDHCKNRESDRRIQKVFPIHWNHKKNFFYLRFLSCSFSPKVLKNDIRSNLALALIINSVIIGRLCAKNCRKKRRVGKWHKKAAVAKLCYKLFVSVRQKWEKKDIHPF